MRAVLAVRTLTLLALALFAADAHAQWEAQSPLPTHLNVGGIAAPSANRVFLGTADDPFDEGGALWESTDGGSTWIQRDVPFSLGTGVSGVFFLDDLRGWLWGNTNYRTTDGGATWLELPLLGSAYFMQFYTADFGLTTGNFGAFTSQDGGLSWSSSPNNMRDFDFADSQLGLGIADTGIYRTTDGGATFSLVLSGDASAAKFLSPGVAVGIVDDSFVRSIDSGATWTTGVTAAGRTQLSVASPSIVLAWGRGGTFPDYDDRLLRSGDAGMNWVDLGEPMGEGVLAFAFPTAATAVAADYRGNMFHSSDAGQTWVQVFPSPGPAPFSIFNRVPSFPDGLTGYYAYGPGFVIKTTDGGASWQQISSGTGTPLLDMDRFPDGRLIAVGENGVVVTSSDGIAPWELHPVLSTSDLEAVHVVGPQEVVTVDRSGIVYRSSDAGATWTAGMPPPLSMVAEDLHFVSLLEGWIIGGGFSGAALFHTTDGGVTWTPITDFQGTYFAVDFEGSSGWASNVSGTFYRTIDDGATWTSGQLPGFSVSIQDMDFYDVSVGYAVGSTGYAARSDDGGATWQVLPTPNSSAQLTDIYLLGPNEVWLSTNEGAAYYSATGGQNWAVMDAGAAGFGAYRAVAASPGGDAWMAGWQGIIKRFSGPPPPPINWAPEASFDFETTGLSVTFTDTSNDPDGLITSWLWDFGDSTTSTEQHPTHVFQSADTYIVTLLVTDDDGDTGGAGRHIVVQPGPGGTFGEFVEVTPWDPLFVTPQDEDFWVATSAPADYDGDGDLDIAVLGYYVVYGASVQERLVLIRNDGPATADEWEFAYVDVPLGNLYSGRSDMAWGDADGDGDLDLAVGSEGTTVIYHNDAGTLLLTDTELPGYREDNSQADFDVRSITWADYDNDGDQDLLIPSVFDDVNFVYRTALMRNEGPNGTGGWTFTEENAGLAPTTHAQSIWADYDGDQDLDLLLVHLAPLSNDGFIRRYRNEGAGVFTADDVLDSLTIEHGEAQWGDYDADGDLDILVAGLVKELSGSFNTVLRIYRNDAETYVPIEVIPCPFCEGWWDFTAASWGDYDSDGDMDILLAGNYNSGTNIEGRAKIYDNEGGTFSDSGNQLPAPLASGDRGGSFSWLDIDDDADLDYFIAGQYFVPGGNNTVEAQMHVYRNDAQGQNLAPSAPTGLNASVGKAPGNVQLSWSPASDDLTPAAALTYDLRVYSGQTPVAIPHLLPEPGNVSSVSGWTLNGLPEGSYTWTLQAVDSAYNGSPVAEGAFAVGVPTTAPAADVPPTYALQQNHPNPFNPSTTLRFSLPEAGRVTLAVFDAKGRRVAALLDETRSAGFHEIPWHAEGLASGTYFVRLAAGNFTRTQRIALVK